MFAIRIGKSLGRRARVESRQEVRYDCFASNRPWPSAAGPCTPGQAPGGPKQPTGPIHAPGVEPREELPADPPAQGKGTSQPPGGTVPTNLRMRPDPIGTGGLPRNLRPRNPDGGRPASPVSRPTPRSPPRRPPSKRPTQGCRAARRGRCADRREAAPRSARRGAPRRAGQVRPFVSNKKFKEGLHAALDELASKGLEKGFVKLIELAIGKRPARSSDRTRVFRRPEQSPTRRPARSSSPRTYRSATPRETQGSSSRARRRASRRGSR